MGPVQSLAELFDLLRRWRDVMLAVVGIGVLATLYAALTAGMTYQSHAVLSTRVNTVMADAITAGQTTPVRLLQLVEQRLTTRENLLDMADRYNMFVGMPTQQRVDQMRGSITLLSQAAASVGFTADGALSSIIVMARADEARKAADIANELAEMIMLETGAGREGRARETLGFLQDQADEIRRDLDEVTEEIRLFEQQNTDMLPFNVELRRAELGQIAISLQDLRAEQALAQAELDTARAQGSTQRRLLALQDAIAARDAQIIRLQAREAELEPFLVRAAQVDRQRETLAQNEARLRAALRDSSSQVSAAESALRLEEAQQLAAFDLVETAVPADFPISRSRRVTFLMGLVASVGLAFVVAFGAEVLRPALRSAGQVERETGMRPVLILPELVLPSERRRLIVARIAGVGLFLLGVAAMMMLRMTG